MARGAIEGGIWVYREKVKTRVARFRERAEQCSPTPPGTQRYRVAIQTETKSRALHPDSKIEKAYRRAKTEAHLETSATAENIVQRQTENAT